MSHFISSTIIMGKKTFFFFFQVGKRESNKSRTYNSSKTSPSRNHKPCSKTLGTFSDEVLPQTPAFLARLWTSSKLGIANALKSPGFPSNKSAEARFCSGFHLTTYFFSMHNPAVLLPNTVWLQHVNAQNPACSHVMLGKSDKLNFLNVA